MLIPIELLSSIGAVMLSSLLGSQVMVLKKLNELSERISAVEAVVKEER